MAAKLQQLMAAGSGDSSDLMSILTALLNAPPPSSTPQNGVGGSSSSPSEPKGTPSTPEGPTASSGASPSSPTSTTTSTPSPSPANGTGDGVGGTLDSVVEQFIEQINKVRGVQDQTKPSPTQTYHQRKQQESDAQRERVTTERSNQDIMREQLLARRREKLAARYAQLNGTPAPEDATIEELERMVADEHRNKMKSGAQYPLAPIDPNKQGPVTRGQTANPDPSGAKRASEYNFQRRLDDPRTLSEELDLMREATRLGVKPSEYDMLRSTLVGQP